MIKVELLVDGSSFVVFRDGEKMIFGSIDDALMYIKRIVESQVKCRDTWYIRVPLSRILDLLAYASSMGGNAKDTVVKYLSERGLSQSNIRIILPTLSSLGLINGDVFTEDALKIGKLYRQGILTEVAMILGKLAEGNCVLREMLSRYRPGDANILMGFGLKRRDELSYTMQLLDFIKSGGLLDCVGYVARFFGNDSCDVEIRDSCISYLAYYVLSRINTNELIENLNVEVSGYSPAMTNGMVYLSHPSGDTIPVIVKPAEFTQANYPSSLRVFVDSMVFELKRLGLSKAILVIPFTIMYNACRSGRVYVGAYWNGSLVHGYVVETKVLSRA